MTPILPHDKGSFAASRRLYRRKKGSPLIGVTSMGITVLSVSFAALLLSFFIVRGFQYEIADQLYRFAGHATIMRYATEEGKKNNAIPLNHPFYARYATQNSDTIEFLQAVRYQAALIRDNQQGAQGILLKGIHRPYDKNLFRLHKGRMLLCGPSIRPAECILSQQLANTLQKNLNDTLIVHLLTRPPRFRKIVITGIFKTNIEEIDQRIVITDLDLINRLSGWGQTATQWEIFLKKPQKIQEKLPHIQNQLEYDLYLQASKHRYAPLFEWLQLLNSNTYVFLGLIFLVVAFNMIALLILLIVARTYTIGVLKALGASHPWIARVFFYRASAIICAGLLIGNILAFALGALQKYTRYMKLDATGYALEYVPIRWQMIDILSLNVGFLIALHAILCFPLRYIFTTNLLLALRAR